MLLVSLPENEWDIPWLLYNLVAGFTMSLNGSNLTTTTSDISASCLINGSPMMSLIYDMG